MPTPWDQKKKAEMARMLAEAEAEAISSDARDEDFTFGGPEGGWEALKAGFGKEATYNFGDEAAAALSDVETTDEERIAANEEMDAIINKNAINAALGFVGGVVPSVVSLGYGAITNAATKATVLAATKAATLAAGKAAGPAAGAAAGKLAAKEVIKKITPLKAIGINAAEGAVGGAGEGEGAADRALKAGIGGTIGAVVGGTTQAAGELVKEAVGRSSKAMRSAINELGVEEATAIESAAVAKAAKEALKKKAAVAEFKLNEKPPDAPETLIDEETGKPYTRDYLERKRITKETERKSPALRRVIREKDVENDDFEMARKRQEQLKFPFPEDPEAIDIGQPEMNIERKIKKNADIGPDEPDVNVPYVDESPTDNIEFKSLKTPRPGQSARLDFSDVDVDEDGNFITGNTFGFKNKSRRPTADQLPTDEEITSANEAAALTRAMKKKNIPLNEARLAIPGSEMPPRTSIPDTGMKMSDVPGGGNRLAAVDPAERRSAALAAIQQERAAAEAAAELPPSVKLERALAEKEYEKQFSPETATEAAKKVQSEAFWTSRPYPDAPLGIDEANDIIRTGVKGKMHPFLAEALAASKNADKGYQLALKDWYETVKDPNLYKIDPKATAVVEQLLLIDSELAPVARSEKLKYRTKGKSAERYVRKNEFGDGTYGRTYSVVNRDGKPKVAKISYNTGGGYNQTHGWEKAAARAIQNVRANATPAEKSLYLKHFPDFEQILERPDDPGGYILVMDELRPMRPDEELELFQGRKALREKLKEKGFLNAEQTDDLPYQDFVLPYKADTGARPTYGAQRQILTADDYDKMSPRVRSFYKALEYMSDVHGIHWSDMHGGNVLVDPKTSNYVAADIGLFQVMPRSHPNYKFSYVYPKDQAAAEAVGRAARQGDVAELAADIAENEAIAAARAPRPLADKATVERARAAGKDIKALSPDEMARRFARSTGSAGAMAAERGFPENEAGQLQMWSNQRMASKDVANPTEAAIKRYMSDFADAGIPEPNRIPTAENYESWLASQQRRLVTMTDKAFRMPRGPEKDNLLSQISGMTTSLERMRDQLRWRSAENAEQMSFDFPEAGGKNIAEQLARRDIAAYRARNPQGMVRIPFFGNKSKPQRELPSAGSTTGGTAMIPVGSKDIIKRAKGPGVIERARKALRRATDDLNLEDFRSERDILESEYDFYNYKLHKATTEPEIRAAERELALASSDLDIHKSVYPDMQDFEAEVKEINDAQASGIYVNRRKVQLINKMIETFRKYPQMMDPRLADDHPVKVAWDTW